MIRRLPEGAAIVTADAMRAAEAAAFASGLSQDALMERAGAAVAVQVARLAAGQPILVLAGPGNNGGDAYAVARLLRARGVDVAVAALGKPARGAAARMAALWSGPVGTLDAAAPRPVLVDGLFGIGRVRPFDAATCAALDRLGGAAGVRIAIDLPSGRDADSGGGWGSADVTIALGALKPAHVLGAGGVACGHVLLADLGLSIDADVTTIARSGLPRWPHDVNKYSRGKVVVVGGAMPGAGWLSANAALSAGAGYVELVTDAAVAGPPHALVRRESAELSQLLADDRIGAVVVGPGLGRGAAAERTLDMVLSSDHPLVVDGDAITLLGRAGVARLRADERPVCLTPHSGEFARMFDTGGTKIDATRHAARDSGAVVVHKGPDTVIAAPNGRIVISAAANAGLSTAGTGDVLTGCIAAQIATGRRGIDPVAAGVWLHTHAADPLGPVFTADALVEALPKAVAQCRTQ